MCIIPKVEDLILKDGDTVAVDLETYDPDLKTKGSGAIRETGFVCGIAVAPTSQTLYYPIHHLHEGQNHDPHATWKELNERLFQNPKIRKVFHNAIYDVCWIRAETGLMPKGDLLDTMIAASVIDVNRMQYSLTALSKDYLGESKLKWDLQTKSEKEYGIKDPMSNMHRLPYDLVKDYAHQDVNLTLKLWHIFEKEINKDFTISYGYTNTKKSLKKIFQLETDLFPCLVAMKFKGVRIDTEKAKIIGKDLEEKRDKLLHNIKQDTNIDVKIWAATSIKKLLDQQNIQPYDKKNNPQGYKTTLKSKMPMLPKDYLKTHENKYLRMVAEARELDKAKNAFIEGVLKYVHKGRIHADINQIRGEGGGAVTGRFSMSNPNLQQIPAKGEIGKMMRGLFLPEEGHEWGSFDYSQQEPRLVVHFSVKHGMTAAHILKKNYNENSDTDFHQMVADMARIPRATAKTINLGLFYGMGKGKLASQLNLNKEEAKELFDQYHRKVPFVRDISRAFQDFADETHLIFTVEDRVCKFNRWEPKDKRWNAEDKVFQIERYVRIKNKETGEYEKDLNGQFKREWKTLPVSTFTKQEAEKDYHERRAIDKDPADPSLLGFDQKYQIAFTYKSLNKVIQGSAADMTKKAMVLLHRKGIIPHIQIHDELCVSVKSREQASNIKEVMEKAVALEVPNKVDCAFGANWGNIKKEETWKQSNKYGKIIEKL